MKSPAIARGAALLLAAATACTAALAQTSPRVLTDAAPLPPEDRSSLGAVVMHESPVLAKREMMENLAAQRLTTSVMGNSAAPSPAVAPEALRSVDPVERPRSRVPATR